MSDINSDYETELEGATIKIGGVGAKFALNINASKWNDESFLNINYPFIITDEEEEFNDGEIEIEIENEGRKEKHKYKVDEDGRLEYEIELDSAPPLPQIVFGLTLSDGLKFYYQDTAENEWIKNRHGYETLEEFLEYFHRSENVEGSYAVYWKKQNNQYKTGKFCHIFRPIIYDGNGEPFFGGLSIQDNILYVTWPEAIEYPIRIDPTIGYSTAGTSDYGHSTRTIGTVFTAPDEGDGVTTLYHAAFAEAAGNEFKQGYYPVSGGDPAGQSPAETVVGTPAVNDDVQTAGGGATILTNTAYYLCYATGHSGNDIKLDSNSFDGFYAGTTYADCMEDPLPSTTADDYKYSMWIDYEGAAPPAGQPYFKRFGGIPHTTTYRRW